MSVLSLISLISTCILEHPGIESSRHSEISTLTYDYEKSFYSLVMSIFLYSTRGTHVWNWVSSGSSSATFQIYRPPLSQNWSSSVLRSYICMRNVLRETWRSSSFASKWSKSLASLTTYACDMPLYMIGLAYAASSGLASNSMVCWRVSEIEIRSYSVRTRMNLRSLEGW